MAIYKDIRLINSKKLNRKIEKTTWRAEGTYTDRQGNNHRYKKRGFTTEEAAKDWERITLLNSKNLTNGNLLFKDVASLYLNNLKIRAKEKSYQDLSSRLENFILPTFKDMKMQKITITDIVTWQNNLMKIQYKRADGLHYYSNEYLKAIQNLLKSIFIFSVKNGYSNDVQTMTFTNLYSTEQQKKEFDIWTPEEFMKFFDVIDDTQYKALFSILYFCGLRIGEAIALKWNDINFHTSEIKINKTYDWRNAKLTTPKTSNSYRSVLMPLKCAEVVKAWHTHCTQIDGYTDNVFVFGFIKPLDDNTIRRKKNSYASKAEVKIIRLHDFRHSHVSLLIDQGFSAFDIAKRLGHTPEMVNNVYGHWFDNSQKKMMDKLNMYFG